MQKTYIPDNETAPSSHIGKTFETLASTIKARRDAPGYTNELLVKDISVLLAKISEEAGEVIEAAQDGDVDHLRYEAADLCYHLLVVLERFNISLDELAAELNMRMKDEERPEGGMLLHPEHIKRGK